VKRHKRDPLPKVDYLDRVDAKRKKELEEYCKKIDISIKDLNLLNRALSHKSYTNELGYSHNEQYEKLEFFGDGVLGLIINEYLFKVFPDDEEGELAKIKSAVVSEVALAEMAKDIELSNMILIGRGEERSGGADRPSLQADVVEALIGAIYIDRGLPATRKFVLQHLESRIRVMSKEESVGDYKSHFQEIIQKETGSRPDYVMMKSSGPEHSKLFRIAVEVQGNRYGIGIGKSKKEAEQKAAEEAISAWLNKKPIHAEPQKKSRTQNVKTTPNQKKIIKSSDKVNKIEKKYRFKDNYIRNGNRSGDYVPDSKIDDPVAWAAEESFKPVFSGRRRKR